MTTARLRIGTQWYDDDTLQCFFEAELVAEAFFTGGQWVFYEQVDGRNVNPHAIPLDPELEAQHRRDQERIAQEPDPGKRAVLNAELSGRRRMYRDDEENRYLMTVRAKHLARKVVRNRQKNEEV